MSLSTDGQPTPDQFAEFLRKRVQEAISASVHHASLSQQYLSLSQRFSALAEQASSGNAALAFQAVHELEREANTGIPAAPIAATLSTIVSTTVPAVMESTPIASSPAIACPEVPDLALREPEFFSPPARFTAADIGADLATMNAQPFPGAASNPMPSSPVDKAPDKSLSAAVTLAPRRKSRRPVSVRSVLERARQVGLETAEKVRVKSKQSDLKPQLRTATEELALELKRSSKPAVMSFILTGLVVLMLALRQMEFFEEVPVQPIIASISDSIQAVEESIPIEPPADETGEQLEQPVEEMPEEPEPEPVSEPAPEPMPEPMPAVELADASLPETPEGTAPSSESTEGTDLGAIDNRSEAGRKVLLEKFGGSAASESAVGFALEWLAARQRVNGTWDFIDVGPCTHKGSVNNPIGGTAYALLPFLAAGQTHRGGQYEKQVQAGLSFLTSIGIAAPAGYDLRGVVNKADDDTDPNYAYYVHGAATLALCEAYGMTKDRKLKSAAEGAVSFLIRSQDPRGGGWRYTPQQPGSTSATAIQVMALKAAEKAGIRIPDATWKGISFYLDSVSVDGAGRYGYEVEKKTYAMSVTSMSLLSRMYLGWGRDHGDLRAGIALIDRSTSTENYYTNYFATQVLKNWGGPEWERWNGRMRDELIARQETDGPGKGSWIPRDRADYSLSGGRLLTTCLATLTLEVYYRNKPLLSDVNVPVAPEITSNAEPPAAVEK